MKKLGILSMALLFMLGCGDTQQTADQSKYNYEEFEGDPMETKIYTLKNGMKVYISVNKEQPRIQTNIAVRAGSKNDPADATGLAHYLEHMLFKGSSNMATSNWAEESKLLDAISNLYEDQRAASDDEDKASIYKMIDSVSFEAAKHAIPNEYDKLVSSLGAKGTNAFTSYEMTVYVNDIPTNEFEKWLMLESERFSELVLRLFHTELETVYEEFNRGQDNDYRKVYSTMDSLLFMKHQYGTQTTIGRGEHLKNPSMVKIHEYFRTYYVPNNMAIILSGDIDPDYAVEKIEKYFGNYEPKDVPSFSFTPEEPISEPRVAEVLGPRAEYVQIGFRLQGSDSKDPLYAQLLNSILNNGKAGLIDLNLLQKQKVLSAYAYDSELKDYSKFVLGGEAKQGQSLDEVKDMLMQQLEMVKKGEFEDWMLEASVNNIRLQKKQYQEQNWYRASVMRDAFIKNKDYNNVVNEDKMLAGIRKDEFVKWVNDNFGDNYALVYKRTGVDPKLHKVSKPQITPVDINRSVQSEFATTFDSVPSDRLQPLWVNYDEALDAEDLQENLKFTYAKNEVNDLFTMYYILDMGKMNDKKLDMAVRYLPFLGTDKYSVEELKKEFFKLGLNYDVFAADDRVYVYFSGLDESFEKGLELFEHLLANATPNEEVLTEMVKDVAKERANEKLEKFYIHGRAMTSYGKYGATNPVNDVLSNDELSALGANELVDIIKSLTAYQHQIFYYGLRPKDDVKKALAQYHKVPEKLSPYPPKRDYPELSMDRNQVFFVDYDMVQAEIRLISKGDQFNKEVWPYARLFNEYFGSGLSSIIFQEIRESKGLAYSAYSYYSLGREVDKANYVNAYVGTQRDKLKEAVAVLLDLMNEMPEAPDQFEDARLAALKKIESERIVKQNVFWTYQGLQKRGIGYDIRKEQYDIIQNMTLEDLKKFFSQNIANNNYSFLVIGKKAEMDMAVLSELGEVKELTLEELFGY